MSAPAPSCRCAARTRAPSASTPNGARSSPEAAALINEARPAGGRIVAVGTTALRLLETAARDGDSWARPARPFRGLTDLFLLPGHRFRSADALMTNFHLPRSSLFMLVCAFAGTERMRAAYAHAIAAGYRFYSYGDASLLFPAETDGAGVTLALDPRRRSDGAARAGVLHTAHGQVETPVFMPVGTAGTVKAMTADAVRSTGARLVLGNTYHLMLRPGAERVEALGGLHRMMDWHGPILTDSGGYQVMSLAALRSMDEDGVTFRSHIDGTQPPPDAGAQHRHPAPARRRHHHVLRRVHALPGHRGRGREVHAPLHALGRALPRSLRAAGRPRPVRHRPGRRAIPALRAESVEALTAIGFDGYAVGGLAVGEGQAAMFAVLDCTRAAAARRPAALPHGRRHAGRHHRRGAARRGHVRLRHPDALRPHRPRLHAAAAC